MHTDVKTKQIDLTPDIKQYLDEKLSDVEKLIDPNDTSASCRVQLGKKGEQHQSGKIYTAKANLHISRHNFRATAREESIMAAIDTIKDELMRELHKNKTKKESLIRRGGARLKDIVRGFRR